MRGSKSWLVRSLGLVAWSTLLLVVGAIVGHVGPIAPYAEAAELAMAVVELEDSKLAGEGLGEFGPYSKLSDFDARGHTFYQSVDGNLTIGVWEATPGVLNVPDPYEVDELMYVLEGKIVLTDSDGNASTHGPGDGVVLPKGWTGTFAVPEGVRKIYVTYTGE